MAQKTKPTLSKNIVYNLILTVSSYIFPLLTFPYITRVLGPDSYGAANFILSIVDYAVMLSSLGIVTVGIREIAKCNGDESRLNSTFSSMLSLHMTFALIIGATYVATIFAIGEFRDNYPAYLVGLIKIVSNVFLIEWLYSGLQNFRYITIRSISVKVLYVGAIFMFVHAQGDYLIYILITVLQVFINAAINWQYSHRFVSFRFSLANYRNYLSSALSLGVTTVLWSFYGTFIIMYLGFVCSDASVGYYSASTRLYSILLSILTAFNLGLMPYINSLYGQGEQNAVAGAIGKALNFVMMLALPMAVFCFVMADDIITVIAGPQYQESILLFRIIILNLILVAVSQVTEMQVLVTLNKTKQILLSTGISVIGAVLIMVFFAQEYGALAAAYAVTLPHLLEASLYYYFARKNMSFNFPWRPIFRYLLLSLLIVGIVLLLRVSSSNPYIRLFLASFAAAVFYMVSLALMKDSMVLLLLKKVSNVLRLKGVRRS